MSRRDRARLRTRAFPPGSTMPLAVLAALLATACGGGSSDHPGGGLDLPPIDLGPRNDVRDSGPADPVADAPDTGPGVIVVDIPDTGIPDPGPGTPDPGPFDPGFEDPGIEDPGEETASPDDPGPAGDATLLCGPRTQVIYVVTEQKDLKIFDPKKNTFTQVGKLKCPTTFYTDTPFSMGIDRLANAWVLYSDGSLWKVSTLDASCEKTTFQDGWNGGNFGMGFATDTPGGTTDTLYVSRFTEVGSAPFGTLSFPDLVIHPVGSTPGGSGELSGNGNAELWGFFPNASPATVSRIDKATGVPTQTIPLSGISGVQAWAFATWGGQFYVFAQTFSQSSSSVLRVAPGGAQEVVVPNAGATITGAGVSSCAPTGAPQGAP